MDVHVRALSGRLNDEISLLNNFPFSSIFDTTTTVLSGF